MQRLIAENLTYFHFFGLWSFALVMPHSYKEKLPLTIRLVWSMFLCLALIGISPTRDFSFLTDQIFQEWVYASSLMAYALLVIVPILVMGTSGPWLLTVLVWFFAIDILVIYFDVIKPGTNYGLMNGRTFDIAAATLLLPLMFGRSKLNWIFGALTVSAVLYFGARTSIVMMAAMLWAYLLQFNRMLMWIYTAICISAGSLYLAYNFKVIVYASRRTKYWAHHFDFWIDQGSKAMGIGTYEIIGLLLPLPGQQASMYIMHNDFLQILWEGGIAGLIVFLILCSWVLYQLRGTGQFFCMAIGYIVMMLAYFPLHALPTQILGAVLIWAACEKVRNEKRRIAL